jgi:hypothetical protein
MKCTEFEDRLNQLLDDRRAPQDDPALQAHAATCSDCQEMLAVQESLFRGMALLHGRTAAPELGKRVLRELNAPAPTLAPLPSPPRRSWWTILASAAAVLLAVGFSVWLVTRTNQGPAVVQPRQPRSQPEGLAIGNRGVATPKVNQVQPAPPAPPLVVKQESLSPPQRVLTPEEREAYRQTMASLASQWSTGAQWPQLETIDIETINMEQYAPGIRPIRESFGVALDALLKTIPSGKKETPPAPPQALQPYGSMTDLA